MSSRMGLGIQTRWQSYGGRWEASVLIEEGLDKGTYCSTVMISITSDQPCHLEPCALPLCEAQDVRGLGPE